MYQRISRAFSFTGITCILQELKVQRVLLLFHYAVVVIFTFAMMLLVYLYTPPVSGHV